MLSRDDLLGLTDDLPVHLPDAYESQSGRLMARAAGLFFLPLIVFLPLIAGKLTWADQQLIGQLSQQSISSFWTAANGWLDAALFKTVLAQEHRMTGDELGLHLTSAALHGINSVLLWLILRRLQVPGAWLAAALFAIHPVELQSTAWLGRQNRLWSAMAFFGAVLLHLRACDVPPIAAAAIPPDLSSEDDHAPIEPDPDLAPSRWTTIFTQAMALLLFVVGLLFQPSGVVIIPVLWLVLLWRRGWRRLDAAVWATLLIVAGGAIGIASWRGGGNAGSGGASAGAGGEIASITQRGSAIIARAGWGATRIVWPFPMIDDWRAHRTAASPAGAFAPAVALLVAATALFWLRRRIGWGPLIALAIFVCLIPTMTDDPPAAHFARWMPGEDSLLYLAGIPLMAMFAVAALAALKGPIWTPNVIALARALLGLIILVPTAIFAWTGSRSYANTESLWRAASAADPTDLAPRVQLATWYLEQGRPEAAAAELQSIDVDRCTDVNALLARGRVAQAMRDIDQAIRYYARAHQLRHDDPQVRSELAGAYAVGGDAAQGASFFADALRDDPASASLLNDYGLFLSRRKDPPGAEQQFRAAIALDSRFAPARINLASLLFARGELAEAAEQLQAAVKADPKNFDAFHNAGVMLFQLKDFPKAEEMLRVAVRLRPDSPEARNDLGVCLVAVGKLNAAVFEFQQALSLRADYESARQNLQIARRRMASQTQPTPPTPPTRPTAQ